jgi:hypothetical protein
MENSYNMTLIAAAALSAIAALLHVCIIFGGPRWYRFFGAGERLARAAEQGKWYPGLVTFGIAAVLALWAAYALSGAGVIAPLPFLKPVLLIITAIYLLRACAILLLPFLKGYTTAFVVWSSLICLGFGAVHLVGVVEVWPLLNRQ